MTPERLEEIAQVLVASVELVAMNCVLNGELYALNPEALERMDSDLRALAAKMREPDGWHCLYGDSPDTYIEEWVSGKHDPEADSSRPFIYIDDPTE